MHNILLILLIRVFGLLLCLSMVMEYFLPVWRFAIRGADKRDLETLDLGFTGLGFEIADRCFSWPKALGEPFARPFRAAVYGLGRVSGSG